MFTFKNLAAMGLFLFGTTFLWMTASFAGQKTPPTGSAWSVEQILALVAIVGFSFSAWGVFKGQSWWETAATASAIVGVLAVIPYMIGLTQLDAGFSDSGVQINIAMHVVGSALVLGLVLLPAAHEWFTERIA
jgi:hypothetical protein